MTLIINNEQEYVEACKLLETIGDLVDFEETPILVRFFDKLINVIMEYQKVNYPMSDTETTD